MTSYFFPLSFKESTFSQTQVAQKRNSMQLTKVNKKIMQLTCHSGAYPRPKISLLSGKELQHRVQIIKIFKALLHWFISNSTDIYLHLFGMI